MTIGEQIQKARKAQSLSQKDLGEMLGVSASMIGQYENNLRRPKLETLVKIADALQVNPADLDESLTISLGSDVMYQQPDGSFVTVDSQSELGHAASILTGLNEVGKREWIKRGEEMLQILQYKEKSPEE